MQINTRMPISFGANSNQKSAQELIELLKKAIPTGGFAALQWGDKIKDQFTVKADPSGNLVVSSPIGFVGSSTRYIFNPDGSIERVQNIMCQPPQRKQLYPAGTVPQDVFEDIKRSIEVDGRLD